MDSEVQSNASSTSKRSSKKLTSLYKQIEKRSKATVNKVAGAVDVQSSQRLSNEQESKNLQPILDKLKRHRNELDKFNGVLQRMSTVMQQQNGSSSIEDNDTISEAILLMKEQSQITITRIADLESAKNTITERLDAIETTKDVKKIEESAKSDSMHQEINKLKLKVQEMSAIESKVDNMENTIAEWTEKFKKRAKKKSEAWIETPTLENSIKASQTEQEKGNSLAVPPAIEQDSSKPNDSHNREEVQQEIGTVDKSVNLNGTV